MKIGDKVYVQGYVDEIRNDTVIIRNDGGYFGTVPSEVITGEMPERKKGEWLETDSHEPCWYKCDQCGRLSDIKEIYCPTCGASMANTTCGADMRGEQDDR